jgi:integrase
MRSQGGIRAYGPYPHRKQWRVVIRERGQRDLVRTFDTEEKARAVVEELRSLAEGKTVSQALDAFLKHLRGIQRAPNTINATRGGIRRMLGPHLATMMVRDLTPSRARAMYDAMRARVPSVASQHGALERSKAWGAWMSSQGWARGNPFAGIKPIGSARRGKPQLRLDEARQLVEYCVSKPDRETVSVLCYLLLGIRQGELRALAGRDVDDGGALLWIERGKTRRARRHLEVPPLLAPHLKALADQAGQLGRVFPGSKEWVRKATDRVCAAAEVPRVTPHGLRGTHSTLAVRGGTSSSMVMAALDEAARSLGQASTQVTLNHYVAPGAADDAAAKTVLRVLAGGRG